MALPFWDRMNDQIRNLPSKQEVVAQAAGIKYQTLRGWITKNIFPRADKAVAIASVLGITVEELVDGEDGLAYVRGLFAKEGKTSPSPADPATPHGLSPAFIADCLLLAENEAFGPLERFAHSEAEAIRESAEYQAKKDERTS